MEPNLFDIVIAIIAFPVQLLSFVETALLSQIFCILFGLTCS